MGEIDELVKKRGLKPADCAYHTIRVLENNGRVRALAVSGEGIIHIEYRCPKCGHEAYKTDEYKKVSKAARIRFRTKCEKCGFTIAVEKLKGGKKKK